MSRNALPYVLADTALLDFREARRWSKARWGNKATRSYFRQLHEGAEYVAAHQAAVAARQDLAGDTELGIHPVGEHYLVYTALDARRSAIVALIRQTRDVPAILKANHFQIQRALREALKG